MTDITALVISNSSLVTAMSTVVLCLVTAVLCFVTFLLYKATKKMAEASSQPFIVATFEANQWTLMYCDLVITNSGNASAFDIEIEMSPDTRTDIMTGEQSTKPIPMNYISFLPPGKEMRASFSKIGEVIGEENSRRIIIKWKRCPKQKKIESLMYDHFFPPDMTQLGDTNPGVKIANQMEKIQKNLKSLGGSSSPFKVDAHIWKK